MKQRKKEGGVIIIKNNKVTILKKDDNRVKLILNGQTIDRVLDFDYKKSSAADTVELTLKIEVSEIKELFE